MAARKTPQRQNTPRQTNAKPTVRQQKAAQANKLGYDSVAAMQSVARYAKAGQSNVIPHAAMVQRIAAAGGWAGQPVATPVNIGGARWMLGGAEGALFTGQRSDAAKRNPGAAYNAPKSQQVAYGGAKGKPKGRGKGKGKGKGKGGGRGGGRGGGGGGGGGIGGADVPPIISDPAAVAAAAANQFATGVSGATNQFITEAGQSSLAEGESEAGKTGATKRKRKGKGKRGKGQAKKPAGKLVKRGAKGAGVKPKVIRRAIQSKGTSAAERRLYASAGNKKLSSRLRLADRRINRTGKK